MPDAVGKVQKSWLMSLLRLRVAPAGGWRQGSDLCPPFRAQKRNARRCLPTRRRQPCRSNLRASGVGGGAFLLCAGGEL